MTSAEDRYRALLDASNDLADQPTATDANESVAHQSSAPLPLTRIRPYALAILSVAVALGASLVLQHFHFRVPQTLLLFAVAISAWYGGRGPALLAGILSITSFYWYFVEPVRTVYIHRSEIPFFIIFTAFVALLSWFGSVRRRVETELQRSEAYLAEGQRLSHSGSWALDVASEKYVYVSEECLRIYGFDPQDGLPTREAVFRRIYPEDREHVERSFGKSVREKVDSSDELRIVLPDGTVKHIHVTRHPVLNSAGDVIQLVGTSVDVTEHKRAEEALRESEGRFRAFVDHAADAFCIFDEQHKVLDANREACESLGYTREELIGMVPQVFDPDADAALLQWINDRIAAGEVCTFETRNRRKDGTVFPVEVRVRPFQLGGRRLHLALARNISERKRAEEALRESESYLAEAQKLSHTGSFAFDVASNKYVYISEECLRIFDLDAQQSLPPREAVSRLIHPEDWDRVQGDFEKLLREKVDTPSEFRIVLPSGAVKHILVVRQPVLNSTGDVITIVGTAVDITERVRSENELRESKARSAQERDRLGLLLEINNHIVNKLEVDELFRAVAASVRKHFANDVTSFLILNKQSGCLERKFLDFPTGRGILEKVAVVEPSKLLSEWWRLGKPVFYSPPEADIPPALREADQAESILSAVSVPLVGADGPLGLLNIGDRKANAFREADLGLLLQIGTQISLALDNALAYGRLRASRDNLEHQRLYLESEISSEYNFEDIVGKSSAIQSVLQQVSVVAPTDSIVLLHGETGTGKELIARAIHNLSSRRDRPFVRMNCAAIPSGLLESELFGHEKGAFTGALMQRRGRFELADHGSLFLDEIGDISLELQPKLLRAVQEQEFERLGSAKTIHVDVRIIAATHRDLRAMIREGKFREDLFYRLNVFPIEIPPLRERREDMPLLVNHFVFKVSRRMGKKIKSIPQESMEVLNNHSWPGNVRELANFLERAVILTHGDELEVPLAELGTPIGGDGDSAMTATVQKAERAMIIDALRAASGRISGKGGAAERLGLKRTTLQHKMQRLGIRPTPKDFGQETSNLAFRDKQ
jgi:formate hydrogenlyase transcriptional activator